ncbi:hypothetical protein SETIT_7G047300v2 [Setaria italica]|uniref:Uncharacterized protein n=2 Tax=Setaria TaxID=4554 RepID=A0A368RS29_SETIT|nr:hypothetical protein SETIT_7G047300v2 [Setaria italica]TKW03608.1 hypothetical protein SEVIR_7G052400v2 [Setaria viridis]
MTHRCAASFCLWLGYRKLGYWISWWRNKEGYGRSHFFSSNNAGELCIISLRRERNMYKGEAKRPLQDTLHTPKKLN